MCCRYYIEPEDVLLAQLADAASRSPLRNRFLEQNPRSFTRSGEVSPDSLVPVLATSRNGRKACFLMQWGFHCDNRPLLPNARLETAAVKPLFQSAWKSHRCVIPASWYYEWEHFLRPDGKKETKDKYLIQPRGESITWLCGLYRFEQGLPHFVILTRAPSEAISFIHNRMPLMIREKDVDVWIHPDTDPLEIARRAVIDLHYEKAKA